MWVAPSRLGRLELLGVDVDGDDRGRAGQRGAGDRGDADAAAADDGDGLAAGDLAGVDRGADAGHHAAAEQADGGGTGRRVDLGALAGGDQGLLRERADAERRGQLGARPSARVIFCVALWVLKQYCRLAALAGPALAADRPPVEDHEVARRDIGDVGADGLDDARGLVAEQEREVVVDAALAVVQVGVADPAGLDLHHGLARTGVRHVDRDELDRRALGAGDDGLDLLHVVPLLENVSGPCNRMRACLVQGVCRTRAPGLTTGRVLSAWKTCEVHRRAAPDRRAGDGVRREPVPVAGSERLCPESADFVRAAVHRGRADGSEESILRSPAGRGSGHVEGELDLPRRRRRPTVSRTRTSVPSGSGRGRDDRRLDVGVVERRRPRGAGPSRRRRPRRRRSSRRPGAASTPGLDQVEDRALVAAGARWPRRCSVVGQARAAPRAPSRAPRCRRRARRRPRRRTGRRAGAAAR